MPPRLASEIAREISRLALVQEQIAVIEAAWLWTKHQPKSTLTRWFMERTNGQSGRIKRIMIVAVARKLAIALWRYVELGLVPQGAILELPKPKPAR